MNTNLDPRELALLVARRADFNFQVGAVLADQRGVFSWGWAHWGDGHHSVHAEVHAIRRANPRRVKRATLYVAAIRRGQERLVLAAPCAACRRAITAAGVHAVQYTSPQAVVSGWEAL